MPHGKSQPRYGVPSSMKEMFQPKDGKFLIGICIKLIKNYIRCLTSMTNVHTQDARFLQSFLTWPHGCVNLPTRRGGCSTQFSSWHHVGQASKPRWHRLNLIKSQIKQWSYAVQHFLTWNVKKEIIGTEEKHSTKEKAGLRFGRRIATINHSRGMADGDEWSEWKSDGFVSRSQLTKMMTDTCVGISTCWCRRWGILVLSGLS